MTTLFDIDDSEQRIERMLAKGRAVMREALEQYKPIAIMAAFSGGNDSIVSTHFACEEFGATAVTVDTLIGVQVTRDHGAAMCRRFGWQHEIKRAVASGHPAKHRDGSEFGETSLPGGKWTDGDTQYEEFVLNWGFPGAGQHARMYQRLKERSFAAWLREAKQGHKRSECVMFVSGIRHDESAIRAGYQRAIQKQGGALWVNPFYWTTATDFELYRQEFGLPRNPVSARIGISGECLCGAFAKPGEIELIRQVDPQVVEYIEGLERRCESLGLPCKWGQFKSVRDDSKPDAAGMIQRKLWGDEPEFRPACVGCDRRSAMNAQFTA